MNDQENEPNQQNHGPNPTEEREPSKEPKTPVFDAILSALRKGAEQARREAEEAVPKVKSAATDAAYWTAYGVSFAAVFQWTLVRNLTPEIIKTGCQDGVKAGREAAGKWGAQFKRRNEPATTPLLSSPVSEAE